MSAEDSNPKYLIVGTAGHIDHGKTALVKALTGVDADRFPEEKQRGITIDIGFAELELSAARIGFVDVPGHEKFVKNMLAGASGIDVVMLIVAADEGVMPQTREHFEICRLLGIRSGIIVLTKKDLVDDELLELVTLDVHELVEGSFLGNAPVIAVSARDGEGIEDLKRLLSAAAAGIPVRNDESVTRMPIDRSFSVKGFGAVVTGTLAAGELLEGTEIELMPAGRTVRIRGIQTHGKSVPRAVAGQRTAVNLAGVDHAEIERGMVLAEPGGLRPTQSVDCRVEVLSDAPHGLRLRQRVRVHIGTVEALARVKVLNESGEIAPGATDFVQLRLEAPIVCVPDERFILRFYSPQTTIAGGTVLDNAAARHRRADLPAVQRRLAVIAEGGAEKRLRVFLEMEGESGLTRDGLRARTGLRRKSLEPLIGEAITKRSAIACEHVLIGRGPFDELRKRAIAEIEAFHRREPLARGIPRETLREKVFSKLPAEIFRAVLNSLENDSTIASDKDSVRLAAHSLELSGDEKIARERLAAAFADAGLEVPKLDEALESSARGTGLDRQQMRKVFQLLINTGEIVKVTEEFYFARRTIDGLIAKLRRHADSTPDRLIDVGGFKDMAGISRKYAIPLLEYFDRERVTRRAGDKRLIS